MENIVSFIENMFIGVSFLLLCLIGAFLVYDLKVVQKIVKFTISAFFYTAIMTFYTSLLLYFAIKDFITTDRYWLVKTIHYMMFIIGIALMIVAISLGLMGDYWNAFWLAFISTLASIIGIITSLYITWKTTPDYTSHRINR